MFTPFLEGMDFLSWWDCPALETPHVTGFLLGSERKRVITNSIIVLQLFNFKIFTDHVTSIPTDHIPTTFTDHILTTYQPHTNQILSTYRPHTVPTTYQQHTNYMATTHQPHTDHIPTTFTDHILTTYQPHTEHIPTTYCTNHIPTTYQLHGNHTPTTYWPHTDYIPTTYRPHTDQIFIILLTTTNYSILQYTSCILLLVLGTWLDPVTFSTALSPLAKKWTSSAINGLLDVESLILSSLARLVLPGYMSLWCERSVQNCVSN